MTDLKQRRKKIGISGAELSRRCGCSRAYICMLESGRSKPSEYMLAILHKALVNGPTEKERKAKEHTKEDRCHTVGFRDATVKKELHEIWCRRYGVDLKRREEAEG